MFWVWAIGGLFVILFIVWAFVLYNRNKNKKKSESSFDAGELFDLGDDIFDIFD